MTPGDHVIYTWVLNSSKGRIKKTSREAIFVRMKGLFAIILIETPVEKKEIKVKRESLRKVTA